MKQLELPFRDFYKNRMGKGGKPSEPNKIEIRMPSYEEGVGVAKKFVDTWTIYKDFEALDIFYNSLQKQFTVFCNISDKKEMQKRTDWVFACEKLIATARKSLKEDWIKEQERLKEEQENERR